MMLIESLEWVERLGIAIEEQYWKRKEQLRGNGIQNAFFKSEAEVRRLGSINTSIDKLLQGA